MFFEVQLAAAPVLLYKPMPRGEEKLHESFSAEEISRIQFFTAGKTEGRFYLTFVDVGKLRLPYTHSETEKIENMKFQKIDELFFFFFRWLPVLDNISASRALIDKPMWSIGRSN